jgi:hypothetical protein
MDAPADQIKIRSSYNLAGVSFTPEVLSAEIKRQIPDFKLSYDPDFRQAIADSWPDSIADTEARTDWGWKHEFDLAMIVKAMLKGVKSLEEVKS